MVREAHEKKKKIYPLASQWAFFWVFFIGRPTRRVGRVEVGGRGHYGWAWLWVKATMGEAHPPSHPPTQSPSIDAQYQGWPTGQPAPHTLAHRRLQMALIGGRQVVGGRGPFQPVLTPLTPTPIQPSLTHPIIEQMHYGHP